MSDDFEIMTGDAQERLRSIIERIERLEEEKAAIMGDIKEVYLEAKSDGYDVKILRIIVKMRQTDKEKRLQTEAMIDLYAQAIGGL